MYIYEKKSLKLTTLQIIFDAGSMFEKDGQHGTMHLMEHIICKTFKDLYDEFTKNCIEWNAYTNEEMVCFHFSGLDSRLTPELKKSIVKKILGGLKAISEDDFNTEKSVVLQEYADCFNDNINGAMLNIFRERFNDFTAIGKRSDIEAFTLKDAKEIYKKFFTKPARIIEIGPSKTDFSKIEYADEPVNEFRRIKYKKTKNELESVPPSDKAVVVCLGKKIVSKADYPFLKFAVAMLTGGLNSPFYQEIRVKRGLSYYSSGDIDTYRKDGVMSFNACTSFENEEKLVELYNTFFKNIKKYLTKERFDLIYSQALVEAENRKVMRVGHIGDLVRKGLICVPKNIKKINYKAVCDVAKKYITPETMEIIVIKK